jgi:HAD superfamily hydrolase (TIGR01484 family)
VRYLALACDYDGTLAEDGCVRPATIKALKRLKESGRKLLLVSGRELDDLLGVFPAVELFDLAVLENGGLLYRPADRSATVLAEAPPEKFVKRLKKRGVEPLSVGHSIVATWQPHESTVLEVIRELGLEMQVIFNKGAVMVLPSGVNKGTGLARALDELGLSAHNVVAIGDAENDHAFLSSCECGVAVDNALPMLKKRADLVTAGARGRGVEELVEQLLRDDLAKIGKDLRRHHILVGDGPGGEQVCVEPYGARVLVAGPSGSGKSQTTTALLERLGQSGYQFCLIDPEGDYEGFECTVRLGDPERVPTIDEVLQVLARPTQSAVVNLLGVKLEDRPAFFGSLVPGLAELRLRTGRPHWLAIDEAHHLLPIERSPEFLGLPTDFQGVMLVTVHVDRLAPAVLEPTTTVIVVGKDPDETLATAARGVGRKPARYGGGDLGKGQVLVWRPRSDEPPVKVKLEPAAAEHRRHVRKYAKGELLDEECFYFRGPERKLNLKAQNLVVFAQLAEGVDDDTWLYHLRRGDYSTWFERSIKDRKLADSAAEVEHDDKLTAARSRERILRAVRELYTAPA